VAWDSSFKNILKHTLKSADVITETDVPTANLRIDFIIKRKEEIIPPFAITSKSTIVGEFKSERDIFNLNELHKSIAKVYLLSTSEDYQDLCLFYLVASTSSIPVTILDNYEVDEVAKGIFKIRHNVEIFIILLNLLDYTKENYFLGLFASKKKRADVI